MTTETEGPDAAPETPSGNSPGNSPGTPRWMKIILVVSVCLNLLVVGALGAHFFTRGFGGPPRGDGGIWSQGRDLVRSLPRERRRALFGEFQSQRQQFRQEREAVRAARMNAGRALRSGNANAYAKAFDELAEAEAQGLRKFRSFMGDVAEKLTDEERNRFADHLERDRSKRRGKGKWRHNN